MEYASKNRSAPMYGMSDKSLLEREKSVQRNAYTRFVSKAEETFQSLSPGFLQLLPFTGLGFQEKEKDEQQQEQREYEVTTISFSDIQPAFMEYFNDPFSYSGSLAVLAFVIFKYNLGKELWKEMQTNVDLQRKLSPTSHTTMKNVLEDVTRYVYFFKKNTKNVD